MPQLFNYQSVKTALPTRQRLESAWPEILFSIEESPLSTYAFRYLIKATFPNGNEAFVQKCKIADFGRKFQG